MLRRQRYFDAVPLQPGGFLSLTPVRFGASRQRYFYSLCAGQSIHLLQGAPHLREVVKLVNDYSIQQVYAVPMHLKMLCDLARAQSHENDGLLFRHQTCLESSSSMVGGGLQSTVRSLITPRFINSYSVSEMGHLSSTSDFENFSSTYSDIGFVLNGIDLKIVDEDDNQKAIGQIGLLAFRLRGSGTKIDYVSEAGVCTSSLKDGWFFPGDLGYLSENHRLFFVGRNDDLIIFNGINIFPAEIETSAKADMSVKDACAFGIASELHHQLACIAVIPSDGFDQARFMAQLKAKLGSRAPKICLLCRQFPTNGMGKVLRRELSKILAQKIQAHKVGIQQPAVQTAAPPGGHHVERNRSVSDLLGRRVTLGLQLQVHPFGSQPSYDRWVQILIGSDACGALPACQFTLNSLPEAERAFIAFFLTLTKTLLQQGRVPVFGDVAVNAIQRSDSHKGIFILDLQAQQIDFVDRAVYEFAMKEAYRLCRWMAQHPPTPANSEQIFTAIEQRVIKVLLKHVPGGKSTIPVLRVAQALGIPFMHLGEGVFQLGWGSKARRLDRSSTDRDSAFAGKLSHNKAAAASLLRLAGLPAPRHYVVSTQTAALAAAGQLGYPVVVKPVDLDRGEGVTVDVAEAGALQAAFLYAQHVRKSKPVIVEQQVSGVCHRFFVAHGRLLYVVKRWPMSVKGDGVRTVAQLVADELLAQQWKAPWNRSEIRAIDKRALAALAGSGFSAESVPESGVWAPLRRIESTADGGVDEDVTANAHADNVGAALSAASLFGLDVAGVDIISADIAKPWYQNGAIINEVNFAPLLGGADISRSYLPKFFADFLDGDGKIPIDTFTTEEAALAQQAAYRRQGLRCYFVDRIKTCDSSGKPVVMPLRDVKSRVRALICRADVDAVVVCS